MSQSAVIGGKTGPVNAKQHNAVVAQAARLKEQLHQAQTELASKYKAQAGQAEGALALRQEHEAMRVELQHNKTELMQAQESMTSQKKASDANEQTVRQRTSEMALLREELGRIKTMLEASEGEVESLAASNRQITGRVVAEKQRTIEELNRMNDLVEAFKKQGGTSAKPGEKDSGQARAAAAALQRAIGGLASSGGGGGGGRSGAMYGIRPPTESFAAIKAHDSEINAICIGPLVGGGQRLVTASSDLTAKVWDLVVGGVGGGRGHGNGHGNGGGARLACELKGSEGAVMDVALHRMKGDGKGDSDRVAGACADSKVRVWDVATERVKQTFTGHRGKVQAVKWSADGRTLVTGGADRTIMIWDVPR